MPTNFIRCSLDFTPVWEEHKTTQNLSISKNEVKQLYNQIDAYKKKLWN